MRGLIAVVIVIARIGRADPVDSFKPPCAVRAAQERFEHGKGLFESKRYGDAAAEFAAAYQLDAHAKFLLFNLALARRMAGLCKDAIDAYRAFLDAGPPDALAKNARIGIERCESALAAAGGTEPPRDDKPVGDRSAGDKRLGDKPAGSKIGDDKQHGQSAGDDKRLVDKPGDKASGDKALGDKPGGDKALGKPGGKPGGDKRLVDKPGDKPGGDKALGDKPGGKPVGDKALGDKAGADKPRSDTLPGPIVDDRWYRDTLGVSLVAGGAACGLAGATLFLLARSDANATFSPTSVAGYLDDRRAAGRLQTASWIAGGVGAALAIGGAIRFATRGRGAVVVAPAPAGAAVVVEGRF